MNADLHKDDVIGKIFSIIACCHHDGPGLRTIINFKGCPLRCWWCHSPQSQSQNDELAYDPALCISCFQCVKTCKSAAISADNRTIKIDRKSCDLCFDCVKRCPTTALNKVGSEITIGQALEILLRDRDLYHYTGGGVTLSGGEPLYQPHFTLELMRVLKVEGIHVALETCGHVEPMIIDRASRLADLILFDVKVLDDDLHRVNTGVGNRTIHHNLKLATQLTNVRVRCPLVPGINDDAVSIRRLRALCDEFCIEEPELLPFNDAYVGMKKRLGHG